jgi:hypothetical protein
MNKLVLFAFIVIISGCVDTYGGMMMDTTRRDATVDGYDIHVISIGKYKYEAFGGKVFSYDTARLRDAQITAIEKISGCTVVDYEYKTVYMRTLVARVECSENKAPK